jgi:hypothetical protein
MTRIARSVAVIAALTLAIGACSSDMDTTDETDAPSTDAPGEETPAAVDTTDADAEGAESEDSLPATSDTTPESSAPESAPEASVPESSAPDSSSPDPSTPDSTIDIGDDCDELEDLFDDFDLFDLEFFTEVLVVLEDLKEYTSGELDADIDLLIEAYEELGELVEEHGGEPFEVLTDPELEDEVNAILTNDVNDAGRRIESFFEGECPEDPDTSDPDTTETEDTDPLESVDTSDPDVSFPPLDDCDELAEMMEQIDLDVPDIATLLQVAELFELIKDSAPESMEEDFDLVIVGLVEIVQWLEERGLESIDEVFEDEELNEEFDEEFERPETEEASDRIDDYLADACPEIDF